MIHVTYEIVLAPTYERVMPHVNASKCSRKFYTGVLAVLSVQTIHKFSTTPPPSGLSRTLHLFKLPSRKSKTSSCLKVKYVTVSFVKESYKKNRALFQKRLRFSESLRIVATALHWARPTRYLSLQHTATRCNTLQHTATHCNTLCKAITVPYKGPVYFAKKNDLTRIRTLCTPKRALHTLKRTLYTLKRALYKLKKSPLHK